MVLGTTVCIIYTI